MNLPPKVTVVEVGPRDGFQNEKQFIPTAKKVAIVNGLARAGLKNIQVSSVVHPKAVPQLADAEQVMERCRSHGVRASFVPGSGKTLWFTRWKCSPTICRPDSGSRWWMSATRPATEFSIGIMAQPATPSRTAAKTSSKDGQGMVVRSGNFARQAMSE